MSVHVKGVTALLPQSSDSSPYPDVSTTMSHHHHRSTFIAQHMFVGCSGDSFPAHEPWKLVTNCVNCELNFLPVASRTLWVLSLIRCQRQGPTSQSLPPWFKCIPT